MKDLKIWEQVNAAESVDELKKVITDNWGKDGIMQGRDQPFTVKEMLYFIDMFAEDFPGYATGIIDKFRSLPTRQYGIRQQLCYILLHPTR